MHQIVEKSISICFSAKSSLIRRLVKLLQFIYHKFLQWNSIVKVVFLLLLKQIIYSE